MAFLIVHKPKKDQFLNPAKTIKFPLSVCTKKDIKKVYDALIFGFSDDYIGVDALSATLCGINKAIIVCNFGINKRDKQKLIMLNPDIIQAKKYELDVEDCELYPDESYIIPRATEIVVRYQDLYGDIYINKFYGEDARSIQHAVDHLMGILPKERNIREDVRNNTKHEEINFDNIIEKLLEELDKLGEDDEEEDDDGQITY